MSTPLIILLVICIIIGSVGYYLGFYRPVRVMAWQPKAAFVVMAFILIPLLIFVLWSQHDAPNKVAHMGFKLHPSTMRSIGIPGIGTNPSWAFEMKQGKEVVFDFYKDEKNRLGWELVFENKEMLVFNKKNRKMIVGFSEKEQVNKLIFLYSIKK